MRKLLCLAFALLVVTSHCSRKPDPFTLVSPDVACTIILDLQNFSTLQEARDNYQNVNWNDTDTSDDAVCMYALAASELQQYLNGMTIKGIDSIRVQSTDKPLPETGTIIILGLPTSNPVLAKYAEKINKQWQKLDSDQAFRLDSYTDQNRSLFFLSGHHPRGVLYAVYHVLDKLGVRWFAPSEFSELVPEHIEIDLPGFADFIEPDFKIRGMWREAKTHMRSADSIQAPLRLEDIEWMARNRINYFPWDSTHFVHLKRYGFLLSTGTAEPFAGRTDSLCLTNADTLNAVFTDIIDKLGTGEWKDADVLELWAPEKGTWCTCPECSSIGNPADQLIFLTHLLQSNVEQAYSSKKLNRQVNVFAYARGAALDRPTQALPENFDQKQTAFFLFTNGRCYNHTLLTTSCPHINQPKSQRLFAWLEQNVNIENVFICENYNGDFVRDLPVTYSQVIKLDIPTYAQLGLRGINYASVRTVQPGVHALLKYQYVRQAWNPYVSVDSASAEFLNHYYAGISDLMQLYYKRIEAAMSSITTWHYFLPMKIDSILLAYGDELPNLGAVNEVFEPWAEGDVHFNRQWEETYHLIFDARYVLEEALLRNPADFIKKRVFEAEYQLRYAELSINLFDNLINYLTLGLDEPEMKEEAIIRLVENVRQLDEYSIRYPTSGTANGLTSSGVRNTVEQLVKKYENNNLNSRLGSVE